MPASLDSDMASHSEHANSNSESWSRSMRWSDQLPVGGRRRSSSAPGICPKTSVEPLPGHISAEGAPYTSQAYPSISRRSPRLTNDDRDARKSNSTPNFYPHRAIDIRYPLVRPTINEDLPKKSVEYITHSPNHEPIDEKSPFSDPKRQKRLLEIIYGPDAVKNAPIYDWTVWIDWQTRMDVKLTDYYLSHLDLLGNFLESRPIGEDSKMTDFIEILRGNPGWPHPWNMDEVYFNVTVWEENNVDNAWQLFWMSLLVPVYIPINRDCKTFQSQIYALYPPGPAQSGRRPFSVTLSEILKAGLTIKVTTHMHEHLKVVDNDNSVYIFRMTLVYARFSNCIPYNRVVKALGLTTLYQEIISSIFMIVEQDELNMQAERLGILDYGGAEGHFTFGTVFKMYKDTPPKLLAGRALYLENLIRRRNSFWTTLRRDLQKQRKEQPFAFWGSALALFFGICTVIQTVTSVWALAATLRGNNLQALQGISTSGLKVANTPWTCKTRSFRDVKRRILTIQPACISKDDPNAMLKDEVAMSCLFRIDFA
ncbi:hypothetical protein BD410DRAFT_831326 [Rickenella mellea]|uniref:Transmembrane protein n=1 Tax=Rickenella mellea TaxID=50990 RepID=A0A4Y7PRR9_9AGAM|nr:hypothetical protein BD410DRAFT_831326 [Rickenella mellea]